MSNKLKAAGKSSFDIVDQGVLFAELGLRPGMTILDLACGQGRYTLELARRVGPDGLVYAVDLWEEGIQQLREVVASQGIGNIRPFVADVSRGLSLEDSTVDLCLMATVLHDLIADGTHAGTLREVNRVVNATGTLAIVEFNKIDSPPGPPKAIRLSPEQTRQTCEPFGFSPRKTIDAGPYTYLSLFTRQAPMPL